MFVRYSVPAAPGAMSSRPAPYSRSTRSSSSRLVAREAVKVCQFCAAASCGSSTSTHNTASASRTASATSARIMDEAARMTRSVRSDTGFLRKQIVLFHGGRGAGRARTGARDQHGAEADGNGGNGGDDAEENEDAANEVQPRTGHVDDLTGEEAREQQPEAGDQEVVRVAALKPVGHVEATFRERLTGRMRNTQIAEHPGAQNGERERRNPNQDRRDADDRDNERERAQKEGRDHQERCGETDQEAASGRLSRSIGHAFDVAAAAEKNDEKSNAEQHDVRDHDREHAGDALGNVSEDRKSTRL